MSAAAYSHSSIERLDLLTRIESAVARSLHVVLVGAPGTGKTALLKQWCERDLHRVEHHQAVGRHVPVFVPVKLQKLDTVLGFWTDLWEGVRRQANLPGRYADGDVPVMEKVRFSRLTPPAQTIEKALKSLQHASPSLGPIVPVIDVGSELSHDDLRSIVLEIRALFDASVWTGALFGNRASAALFSEFEFIAMTALEDNDVVHALRMSGLDQDSISEAVHAISGIPCLLDCFLNGRDESVTERRMQWMREVAVYLQAWKGLPERILTFLARHHEPQSWIRIVNTFGDPYDLRLAMMHLEGSLLVSRVIFKDVMCWMIRTPDLVPEDRRS